MANERRTKYRKPEVREVELLMTDSNVMKLSKLQSALTLKQFLVMLGATIAGLAAAHQFVGIPILRNELRPLIKEMIEEHERTGGHVSMEFASEMRNWMRRLEEVIKAQAVAR